MKRRRPLGPLDDYCDELEEALATERAAREKAEKEAAQYKLWWDETSKSHDATNAHLEQAEHERDTALARVKELETELDAALDGMANETTARLAAESALASARELLAQISESSNTGRSWRGAIRPLLTSHPAPVAAPERGTRDVVETVIDLTKDDKHSRWNALMARTAELPVTVMATSKYPSPAPCSGCAAARELLVLWYHARGFAESGETVDAVTLAWLKEHGE